MNFDQLVVPIFVAISIVCIVEFVVTTILTGRNWKLARNSAIWTLIVCWFTWSLFGLYIRGQLLIAGVITVCFVLTVVIIYLQLRNRK
jgi:hypothetical protein